MARVTGRAFMVGTRRMVGSRGMVFSADKATKVASTHQCFTLLCSMAMVAMIAAVFGHVDIGGSSRLAWRWDEVGL